MSEEPGERSSSLQDLSIMTRQLATLLGAGLPLLAAIEIAKNVVNNLVIAVSV